MEVAAGHTLWVDMETGVRSKRPDGADIFDLDKVLECVGQVTRLGLKPAA